MKPFINKEEIKKALKDAIDEINRFGLERDIYFIIVGGASLVVKYGLSRTTSDIDVMVRPYVGGLGDILGRRGMQIVSEGIMNLHPDYESRIELFYRDGRVHVFILSPYDIAISKISRGFDKDINDIIESDIIHHIDINRLKELYFESVGYWLGYEERFRWAWEDFERAYNAKFGTSFQSSDDTGNES